MIGIANCNVIRGISKKSGDNSHLPFLTAAVHLFLNFLKASLCQGSLVCLTRAVALFLESNKAESSAVIWGVKLQFVLVFL